MHFPPKLKFWRNKRKFQRKGHTDGSRKSTESQPHIKTLEQENFPTEGLEDSPPHRLIYLEDTNKSVVGPQWINKKLMPTSLNHNTNCYRSVGGEDQRRRAQGKCVKATRLITKGDRYDRSASFSWQLTGSSINKSDRQLNTEYSWKRWGGSLFVFYLVNGDAVQHGLLYFLLNNKLYT